MTDKLVTHEDLPLLRRLVGPYGPCPIDPDSKAAKAVLDRLIAAAEADAPPLPEGWVLASMSGMAFPYWHSDGFLYQGVDDDGEPVTKRDHVGGHNRKWITPLRPTITDADVEKVAYAIFREHDKVGARFDGTAREVSLNAAQAVLRVLDIEVSP